METIEKPKLKVIENEIEYLNALNAIKLMMDSGLENGTEEENYLEVLSILIEKYELENEFKIEPIQLDGIDVLIYFMEENRLQQKDLIPFLGPASRVSEILNKKRKLSLKQIKALNSEFKIPIHLLIMDDKNSSSEREGETKKESKRRLTYKEKEESLQSIEDLSVLENVPAYIRKDVKLSEVPVIATDYYEQMKQKAILRANERFEKLKKKYLEFDSKTENEMNQVWDEDKVVLIRINESLKMLTERVLDLDRKIEELLKKESV